MTAASARPATRLGRDDQLLPLSFPPAVVLADRAICRSDHFAGGTYHPAFALAWSHDRDLRTAIQVRREAVPPASKGRYEAPCSSAVAREIAWHKIG